MPTLGSELFADGTADVDVRMDQGVDEPLDSVAGRILVPPFEPRCGRGSEVLACDAYQRVVCDGDYALVVVVEGLPAGLKFDAEQVAEELARRRLCGDDLK